MYKLEKKGYGYKLVFGDYIKADEMREWLDEAKKTLISAPREFNIFVDMRTLKPLPSDAQSHMQSGQKLFKEKGMKRSVVILNSTVTKLQFLRIAKETGIYNWERYIDASSISDWEKVGLDWINKGIDPDK
jgi:hypothetical protein